MNRFNEPVGENIVIIRSPHQQRPTVTCFNSVGDALVTFQQSFYLEEFDTPGFLRREIKEYAPERLDEFDNWISRKNVSEDEKVFLFDPGTSDGQNCTFLCSSEFYNDEDFFHEYILDEVIKDDVNWAKIYKASDKSQTYVEFLFDIENDIINKHNAPKMSDVLKATGNLEMNYYEVAKEGTGLQIVDKIFDRVLEITPKLKRLDKNLVVENTQRVFNALKPYEKKLAEINLKSYAKENGLSEMFSYSACKHFLKDSLKRESELVQKRDEMYSYGH